MHKRKGRLEWKELKRLEAGKGVVGGMKGGGEKRWRGGWRKLFFIE